MIRTIAQKEFAHAVRDKRFILSGAFILLLLVAAVFTGISNYKTLQKERELAQHTANKNWQNQPDRHPHRMVHYGSYAFRPKSILSFLDPGLDSYTGTSVYLEGHTQNSANFSQVQQSGSMIRLGEMTIALVLQMIVPLLIIFICFGAFSQEKEDGTLKVLLSQGVSIKQIWTGKIAGYSKLLSLVTIPALLLASLFLFFNNDFELSTDLLLRFLIFLGSYALYFFIFIVGSVLVSAFNNHSRTALVTLIGIWIFACIIIPKAASDFGDVASKAPTKAEMDAVVHHEAQKGIDGHNPQDERAETLKKSLLKKYGVDSVSQLPVNIDGVIMAEGEEYSSKVYQQHFEKLVAVYNRQNKISEWLGFINPYLSTRFVSMAATGSDFMHYVHFLDAAEKYRYYFVQGLNNLQATKLQYKDKETRLNQDTWKEFKPFSYQIPSAAWAMKHQVVSLIALLFWAVLIYVAGFKMIEKIKII